MYSPFLEQKPASIKLLFLGGIMLISLYFFTSLSVYFLPNVNIIGNLNILSEIHNKEVLSAMKILQIISSTSLFILPPLIFSFLASSKPLEYLSISGKVKIQSIFFCCLIMFAGFPLMNWLGEINKMLVLPKFIGGIESWMRSSEKDAEKLTEVFLDVNNKKDFFVNILMVAIIPALGEEFIFRGILQKLLIEATKRKHLSIIIASFVFGFFHFQFFTFLPRFLMGVLFGYLLLWSKSLWLPICCHFVNNASAVIFSFLSNKGYLPSDIDDVGKQQNQMLIIFTSTIIATFLIYTVYRTEKKNNIKFISI
ncbi:MAG: CPBP family intramembrane glutamic endopeptidase [Bacteroidales bacterium]|jgi:hypothetical protein